MVTFSEKTSFQKMLFGNGNIFRKDVFSEKKFQAAHDNHRHNRHVALRALPPPLRGREKKREREGEGEGEGERLLDMAFFVPYLHL